MSAAIGELRALTSVRGLAAWLVVFYHIRLSLDVPAGVMAVLARGYLAVDFFFLLSGFVIWMTWGERLREGGWRAVPGFLQRRVARIWPLHVVMLGFGVALALALALTGRTDNGQFPAIELPLHVLLIQNWGFSPGLFWNVPAWSISAEMAAYLTFPVLALTIDWRRVPTWAVVAAVAAFLITLASFYGAIGAETLDHDITRFGVARCLCEFGAGTGVGALWLRYRDRPTVPALTALAVAAVFTVATLRLGLAEILGAPPAFAAMLLVLALTSGRRANPLELRPLHALGEWSFATYLNHYLLWFAFKLAFVTSTTTVPWWQIAAFVAMIVAVSAAQYHVIERPAQRWLSRVPLILPRKGQVAAKG